MSNTFTLHLAKVGRFTLPTSKIADDLTRWFGRIVQHERDHVKKWRHSNFQIKWWFSTTHRMPQVGPADTLVYLLPNREASLAKAIYEQNRKRFPQRVRDGLTLRNEPAIKNQVLSEVYAGCRSGRFIAETIFHEAMHNKLNETNRTLHGKGGLASGEMTGVVSKVAVGKESLHQQAAAGGASYNDMLCQGLMVELAGQDLLTDRNVQDMAESLGLRRKQWVDGFYLAKGTTRKPAMKFDLGGFDGSF